MKREEVLVRCSHASANIRINEDRAKCEYTQTSECGLWPGQNQNKGTEDRVKDN